MSLIFDTHAHYDDEAFDADRETLLASMPEHGVGLDPRPRLRFGVLPPRGGAGAEPIRMSTPPSAGTPRTARPTRRTVGTCSARGRGSRRSLPSARSGWTTTGSRTRRESFSRGCCANQLALAQELDLPVIVHDREAHADSLAIVQEFPAVRGVFHCFSGSVEMARELLKRGWYLGFDGPVTYKNARKTVEVALECPLDRMLLETDSPYMAPVPVRGTRNDSRNVRYIAEKLAALRGLDTDELIRLTAENGKRLFGIG